MRTLILAAVTPDNTPHGYNLTFAFPMLLFAIIAGVLYLLFSRPHRRIPAEPVRFSAVRSGAGSPGPGSPGPGSTVTGSTAAAETPAGEPDAGTREPGADAAESDGTPSGEATGTEDTE